MNNNLYINKNFKNYELRMLKKYFDKLWPLNRSLTGNDVRKTHKILKEVVPLKTFETKSFKKKGIANIGYRPTFKGKTLLLEVNIFGIKINL